MSSVLPTGPDRRVMLGTESGHPLDIGQERPDVLDAGVEHVRDLHDHPTEVEGVVRVVRCGHLVRSTATSRPAGVDVVCRDAVRGMEALDEQLPEEAWMDGVTAGDHHPDRRPAGVSDELVEAVGKLSEAFEYVERARGHLFSFHQLMGHADRVFGEAADLLADARAAACGDDIRQEVVGRNVLDGRWTFQIVEEFDDLYYQPVRDAVRSVEVEHLDGRRHVFESELKDRRRSAGRSGHERRPPRAHSSVVESETPTS